MSRLATKDVNVVFVTYAAGFTSWYIKISHFIPSVFVYVILFSFCDELLFMMTSEDKNDLQAFDIAD